MFLLMPFVSPRGGWVEKYNGKEIALCEGSAMPFETDNPVTHQVWYSGNFSQVNQNFSENEKVLWRVKTDKFKDDAQWEWFLNFECDENVNRFSLHEVRYIEDQSDVYPSQINGKHIGDEFQFPLWVLDLLIERGDVRDKNLIKLIELRRKDEKEQGFNDGSLEELKRKRKEKIKEAQEKANTAFEDAVSLIDPLKEKTRAKAPIPAKVEPQEPEKARAKAPVKQKVIA